MTDTPAPDLNTLLGILSLETIDTTVFRGHSPDYGWARIYGGLVIAQSLMAACRTVPHAQVHSLHSYFLLAGDPLTPIIYHVERLRDGRSFTTRRVVAKQNDTPIFVLSASFHIDEPGHHHQFPMPSAPDPETLPGQEQIQIDFVPKLSEGRKRYWNRPRPVDMRPTDPAAYFDRKPGTTPQQSVWLRAIEALPDDPMIHACALAYMSDMTILDCTMIAHGKSVADPDVMPASLDHALWFHEPFSANDWLLYTQDSPWTGHGRGIGRGLVYASNGRLIASVMQEGLVRIRKGTPPAE